MYKLCFFVPASHLESVKTALFDLGAGRLGNYDCCAWQVAGKGQFRPLAGSSPFIGQKDTVEIIDEYRVEMIVSDDILKPVLAALVKTHPYEQPAYEFWQVNVGD